MINTIQHSRYGPMLVNSRDLYVGEAFMHCGEYGECEIQLLRSMLRTGDVVLAAGANIGALVIPIAQAVGAIGRVVAFEPQLHTYHLLCANLALNDLFHVETFRYAVGAERGVVRIPKMDPTRIANRGGVSVGEGNDAVPILSVDSLGLQSLDVLQADVEGSELAVLQGAIETITTHLPVLYIEADRPAQRGALFTWLMEAGYHIWEHQPPLWNPENYYAETDVRWAHVVSVNWLCVHPENPRDVPEVEHLVQLWPQPLESAVECPG